VRTPKNHIVTGLGNCTTQNAGNYVSRVPCLAVNGLVLYKSRGILNESELQCRKYVGSHLVMMHVV